MTLTPREGPPVGAADVVICRVRRKAVNILVNAPRSASRDIRLACLCAGLLGAAVFQTATVWAQAQLPAPVWIGRFAEGVTSWRELQVAQGLKPNQFRLRSWDGVDALEVLSVGGMSLMARPLTVDLKLTPVLCWKWRISAPLTAADMTRRAGDDYAARLYLSLRIPESEQGLVLRAKLKLARSIWGAELPDAAVNYVWDNRNSIGTEMPNAYTGQTIMVVQKTGATDAGRWVSERRNVGADIRRLFGPNAALVQIAVGADTDNTAESVQAGFADIHFVSDRANCAEPLPG